MFAPLLRADLEGLARLFHGVANAEAFFNGESERLLAVHMAARAEGGDGNRHMPMIGRADGDDIRFYFFE